MRWRSLIGTRKAHGAVSRANAHVMLARVGSFDELVVFTPPWNSVYVLIKLSGLRKSTTNNKLRRQLSNDKEQ